MVITAIQPQKTNINRYSIFVDGKYSFSLSADAILSSRIKKGDEITKTKVGELKNLSNEDKIYFQVLKYVSRRLKTVKEVTFYLNKKNATPTLIDEILSKLSKLSLVDDYQYSVNILKEAISFSPASKRKIVFKLKSKGISEADINRALESSNFNELESLGKLVIIKRRQSKFKDDTKLMQYLTRQGFNYYDVKEAIKNN